MSTTVKIGIGILAGAVIGGAGILVKRTFFSKKTT
jgi:hypothetical protein